LRKAPGGRGSKGVKGLGGKRRAGCKRKRGFKGEGVGRKNISWARRGNATGQVGKVGQRNRKMTAKGG